MASINPLSLYHTCVRWFAEVIVVLRDNKWRTFWIVFIWIHFQRTFRDNEFLCILSHFSIFVSSSSYFKFPLSVRIFSFIRYGGGTPFIYCQDESFRSKFHLELLNL